MDYLKEAYDWQCSQLLAFRKRQEESDDLTWKQHPWQMCVDWHAFGSIALAYQFSQKQDLFHACENVLEMAKGPMSPEQMIVILGYVRAAVERARGEE